MCGKLKCLSSQKLLNNYDILGFRKLLTRCHFVKQNAYLAKTYHIILAVCHTKNGKMPYKKLAVGHTAMAESHT